MQPKTQAMPLIQYKTIQYTFSTPSKIINTYTKAESPRRRIGTGAAACGAVPGRT